MTITTTEYYTGLTLSQLLQHIYFELGQVVGVDISYSRFPRSYVIDKLNDRLNKFVFASQCLRRPAIIQLKANVRNYKLPANCMDGGVISYPKYFSDSDTYQNLEIKDTMWLDDHYEGWLTGPSADTPLYVYMGDSYGNIPMIGVYPPPTADGDSYVITPETGIVAGASLPGATNNITGLATGGDATTLVDSSVDFTTMGLVGGMAVLNVTDGSQAVILSVATTTITFAAALSGGTSNVFAAGNSYNILAGEYGVITSWSTDSDTVLFSSEVGGISSIQVPAGNIWVDYIPYPLSFPASGGDLQIPEIPKLYHMDFAMGVVADLLRTFNETTKEFQRAQAYESIFNAVALQARTKKDSRPYRDKPVSIRPMQRGSRRGA